MKASIYEDEYGIQLCVDRDGCSPDGCLNILDEDELKSILLGIVKYLGKKDCRKIMFFGQRVGGLAKGDQKDYRLEWIYKYEEWNGKKWVKKEGQPQ